MPEKNAKPGLLLNFAAEIRASPLEPQPVLHHAAKPTVVPEPVRIASKWFSF